MRKLWCSKHGHSTGRLLSSVARKIISLAVFQERAIAAPHPSAAGADVPCCPRLWLSTVVLGSVGSHPHPHGSRELCACRGGARGGCCFVLPPLGEAICSPSESWHLSSNFPLSIPKLWVLSRMPLGYGVPSLWGRA